MSGIISLLSPLLYLQEESCKTHHSHLCSEDETSLRMLLVLISYNVKHNVMKKCSINIALHKERTDQYSATCFSSKRMYVSQALGTDISSCHASLCEI